LLKHPNVLGLLMAASLIAYGGSTEFSVGSELATPASGARSSSAAQTLCVAGMQYRTVEDDEFSRDQTFSFTPDAIGATPRPDGIMWSTSDRFVNEGTSDTYSTDSTQPYFGGYSPYSISGGALNVTAEPVPTSYAEAASLVKGTHRYCWLSGNFYGAPQTYGYVEVSAKLPNMQGVWPAPLWLEDTIRSDGRPPNIEELDAAEMFGDSSMIHQTIHYGYDKSIPGEMQETKSAASSDPAANYHSYGILWTPTTAQFFIDRGATSPVYRATATGPMRPFVSLAIFAPGAFVSPPTTNSPQTMSLQYFRWYQTTGAACSPSVISSAP
jgi:hypothetical protein